MELFNLFVLIFVVLIMSSYVLLASISISALRNYLKENKSINYEVLMSSAISPKISVIAPAYNEANTIKENIQSLLSLNYPNFEVIVVNDGSTDDTMKLLNEAYKLKKTEADYQHVIPTEKIREVYHSSNPAFSSLVIINKENGGKADALNAGLNAAKNDYVVCIDVDCIMDKDALLKMAKPFMQQEENRVIAAGGVVRIANSCIVKGGRLVEIKAPKKFLPRTQVLEYLRAFLLGRMGWSKMDGLLLISGAVGMFDKKIALEAGGYDPNTVGEDMELIVRMRRYMIETKRAYTVKLIPDPLCWTEAPETIPVLRRQRSRWTRGTMETLWKHRKMFFNPKYKLLGMVSIPYWFLFEYLAPIIEVTGIIITIYLIVMGMISWNIFFLLLLFVYTFAVMISSLALLTEEFTFHKYSRLADFSKLFLAALLEPFFFHPFTVYAALKGNWEKFRKKTAWGEMVRTGFNKSN
ncbi:glycosyltransferase [Gracilimonas sp.]|uniref:glycosyltransferase family 2 protein n=1 Tax=Gracilimonas sp. TaxID=1974203 RepID=UPI0025C4D713|nr:glycosyltransferase [Gracilimonas sp.]